MQDSTLEYFTKTPTPILDYLHQLTHPAKLEKILTEYGFANPQTYLKNILLEILPVFCERYSNDLVRYLENEISLQCICDLFLKHLLSLHVQPELQLLYPCLADYDIAVDKAIRHIIFQRPFQTHIQLLGFGLDNGTYEKKLADDILAQGLADSISLFGFDPNHTEQTTNIQYLHEKDLAAHQFDIILVKWALHHVPLNHRWTPLLTCLNAVADKADIIIVEESCFASIADAMLPSHRYPELLLAFIDIIANLAFHETWLQKNNGNDFFLEYLRCEDISFIENHLNAPFKKELLLVEKPLLKQSLFHYHITKTS